MATEPVHGQVLEVYDARFTACVTKTATLRRLYTGSEWAEGPVWVPAGRYLLWSDIPNDRVLRWDEPTGEVGVFAQPSHYANGATLDAQGRVVRCEHGTRRVVRIEHDGTVTVLADSWNGKRLNSPNDVVVRTDGSLWFSDPTYGIDSDYEGYRADSEIGGSHLFRTDPATGEVVLARDDFVQPNGLAFSLDERQLYVADTGLTHGDGGPHHLRVFDVADDLSLSGGDVFAECTNGLFDGFRLDAEGRIWSSAADGVHVYDPDGTLLGKILVPETVANLVFGGARRTTLFITATTSLYAIGVRVPGAPLLVDHRPAGASRG